MALSSHPAALGNQSGDFMKASELNFAHESWSSRVAFLFAAIGSAVGLGNLWRFPYVAGENGGAAFVLILVYKINIILCI